MKLLLCEDEKELSNALKAILRHNNYTVDAVYDGKDTLAYAEADQYDGIILDLMMPKMNGLEVLSTLRSHGNNTPVLILTAKSETEDKITGLDLGADDYLAKPFDMGELLARVRAVTRRSTGNAIDTITYGDLTLNKQSFKLSTSKETIRLGGKEYGIIELLISNPASLISTEKIMERV
jgi:two-component system response regulator ArlR